MEGSKYILYTLAVFVLIWEMSRHELFAAANVICENPHRFYTDRKTVMRG